MTTYLSRIRLNPTRRGTRKLVSSPQAMHATVMGSHMDLRPESRVLWRLDVVTSHDLQLYVVSPQQPDFTGLIEQAGWPTTSTWDMTAYDPFLERLTAGQQWRFRLTANPVRSLPAAQGTRGKVVPHVTTSHQTEWLRDHADGWGFVIRRNSLDADELSIDSRATNQFSRAEPNSTHRQKVSITTATYDGILEIMDAHRLHQALVNGMGRAKAYGCGLMTLAPVT